MSLTIGILPRDDAVSTTVGDWLLDWAERSRSDEEGDCAGGVCLLRDEAVTRAAVEDALRLHSDADLVAWYGHGRKRTLAIKGRCQDPPDVLDCSNAMLLFGRATYTVACLSAQGLGWEVVDKGGPGTAYFGYLEELILPDSARAQADLGEVVNGGLTCLHRRGDYATAEARYVAARERICDGYLELLRRLGRGSKPNLYDFAMVGFWDAVFCARWHGSQGC